MNNVLEEKVAEYIELREKIAEMEARKKVLSSEISELFPKEESVVTLPNHRVKRAAIFSIKTSLEQAHQFGAVKTQEVVDREKLKQLYREGQNPPGVSEIHYIQVYGDNRNAEVPSEA